MADKNVDVVIIGAGIAGLMAARTLWKHGIHNLTVLEARDRIGGRIFYEAVGDDFVDYGAHFIHGEKGNPVHQFAKENDFIIEVEDSAENVYLADGKRIDRKGGELFLKKFDKSFRKLQNDKTLCFKPGATVGDILDETEKQVFKDEKLCKMFSESERRTLFDLLVAYECVDSAVDDPRALSAHGFYDFSDCDGERFTYIKKGYSSVLDRIASDVLLSVIRLNSVVKAIDYSESCCKITVSSNQQESFEVSSKYVICTLPLGCLQANTITFTPELPALKQQAINSLGFGVIDRFSFFFDRQWWPKTESGISAHSMIIAWTPESKENFKIKNLNPALYERPEDMLWYHHFFGFEAEPSISQPVLVGVTSGRWAKVIEKLPDDEVLSVVSELITRILAPHYSDVEVTTPVRMMRSKWLADPFSRGAYSYVPVGATSAMFKTIAKPLPSEENPMVMFAGEATHGKYFSCVHGAWLSGIREADRVRSMVKK